MQLSLTDALPAQADPAFTGARRFELGAGAWVEHVPGWYAGHTQLFTRLRDTARWELHRRVMYDRQVLVPRLVARCPDQAPGLSWNGEETLEVLTPALPGAGDRERAAAELRELSAILSGRYGRDLSQITLAYYRDGRDSVAFHGDRLGALRADTVVAILSVGARRRFLLRPRATAGTPRAAEPASRYGGGAAQPLRCRETCTAFSVGEGDLLVMGGSCQDSFEHAVPKTHHAGPRIAIMFREAHRAPGESEEAARRVVLTT